jgi:hypothetical protein
MRWWHYSAKHHVAHTRNFLSLEIQRAVRKDLCTRLYVQLCWHGYNEVVVRKQNPFLCNQKVASTSALPCIEDFYRQIGLLR